MGESSAPRRPTDNTNTSPRIRKEVKIAHTQTIQTYKYTMKITGLIASTMLLLVASAPTGPLASPDGQPSIVTVERIEFPVSDGLATGIGQRQDVVKRKLGLGGYAQKIVAEEREERKNRKSRGGTQLGLGGYAQKIVAEEREERKPMRRETQERRRNAKKKRG